VFLPPAVVIGVAGATAGIKSYYDPKRNERLIAESSEMREAFRGFRVVTPHLEFKGGMTLNLGERTLELIQLKNIHSDPTRRFGCQKNACSSPPRLLPSNASAFCARS